MKQYPFSSSIPLLHILGQHSQNDDAKIIGNVAGLLALRNAIDQAIRENIAHAIENANDGETYNINVVCLTERDIDKVKLPYCFTIFETSPLVSNIIKEYETAQATLNLK